MKERGWNTIGIEPSIKASCYAKKIGITIINKPIEKLYGKKWDAFFDAIYAKNFLEHVVDPYAILQLCRKLLTRNGIMGIKVPNDFNILQMSSLNTLRVSPWWVAIPDHINYFTFPTLTALLEKTGFTIINKTTDFPMELFLLMRENYILSSSTGSKCHEKRMTFDLNLTTEKRRHFYSTLAAGNIGRSCIIFVSRRS